MDNESKLDDSKESGSNETVVTQKRSQWADVPFSELPFINKDKYREWREKFDRQKAIEDHL